MALHGGRLIAARRLFRNAPEPFIDLSTGINPLSYPIPAIEPSAWTRLPEPEEIAELERLAAIGPAIDIGGRALADRGWLEGR